MSFPSGAVRSIGLSKSRRLKSTSSSIAMSLEDETQQPLVAGSSQPPGAASSAAILQQLHQQYAPSAPSGPGAGPTHHIIPPSSDPPVAPSSDVTQGPESDGSIAWESNSVLLPPHGSLHCALLDQIAEDPRPSQPVSQPKALTSQGLPASGKSSELTDLVSQTPEFVMESQRDGVDSAKSEMSDVEEDADAASVSTPSTSESEMQTAPAPRTFGLFSGPAMRPITQSVPGLATSPIRTYISPSQHVAKLFTPTKNAKGHLASPSKRYDALPVTFLTVGSQTASTTSSPSKPTRLPTQAAHRGSPILSPKRSALECSPIGDSSDFAEDMMPVRVLNPRERFDATMEAAPLALNEASCSTRSSQASPTRPAHWEALTTQRDSAGCAGEPTFSNENSMDKHDYRNHLVAISRRPFQPDKAQSEVADSEPPSTPTRRPAAVRDVESQTLLNTIAPQGSQTQLNSDNLSPSSSIPRGHFASLDARSAAALSSPGLWGERMPNDEDISVPTATSPPQESFVATQVKPLHPTTSSPFKQLLPATTSSPSNVAQFGRRRAGDEHNTSTTAPPSDADLEPTFVEAVSHSSAGSLEAAQLTASDPPLLRLFPSSIERCSAPELTTVTALGSAPEDREDFSYRPTELGRTRAKAEAVAERTTKASIGSHSPRPDQPAKGKGKRTAVTRSSPKPSKRSRAPTSAPTSPPHKTRSTKRHKRAAISVPTRPSRSMTSVSRTKDASVTAAEAQENGPLRVLAQWNKGDYYAGTVTSRNAGGYHVDFDDGHEVWVSLEQMRLLELRPGEPVCERTPGHVYHVAEQYEGFGDIQAVDTHSKVHRIRVTHLLVLGLEIVRRFSDRCVPRAEMDKRFPESVDVFARKVFIVTSSDERGKDTLIKKIQQNGGSVTSNWTDIFDISDEAHTINTQDKAPFLVWLGSKRVVSSKLMSSLAAGVPVLSPRYIEDTLNGPADWRAYLISPGESALLREPAVQVVDPAWGSASWRASEAQAARQPLAGASVLWVPAGGRWKGHHEINILVPFCLRAMGACITIAASLPADLGAVEQEIVAVEDRDGRKLTKQQRLSGKLVNVGWLKAVLIAGARLPPSIIRN
ncbi:hypothetical protein CspeluHIS016_0405940 [Cutaneotrichosporon spelunceum]|uniref:BRCT domain-containing protein n=1 Tax=Cutaneotrichosporon spelunceum TaxID=1672016 RepID=A0AAD3TWG9_9TREE|nr:hypothetical protein CspeluHIS016_0405940 [Cutaneotrichosporon spelunceum]